MPAQWFAAPYVRWDSMPGAPGRYCQVQDFDSQIRADGGAWDHFECGGGPGSTFTLGVAMVKVGDVTQATLDAIAAAPNTSPIPTSLLELSQPLSVLGNRDRNFIERTLTRSLGYTDAEIDTWLAGQTIAQKTWGQLLDFLATRWYAPRYDPNNPPGPQVGKDGVSYNGAILVDGIAPSALRTPVPKPPSVVAQGIPST